MHVGYKIKSTTAPTVVLNLNLNAKFRNKKLVLGKTHLLQVLDAYCN